MNGIILNIHLCSYKDFYDFCNLKKINIKNFFLLNEEGDVISNNFLINLFTYQVIFVFQSDK